MPGIQARPSKRPGGALLNGQLLEMVAPSPHLCYGGGHPLEPEEQLVREHPRGHPKGLLVPIDHVSCRVPSDNAGWEEASNQALFFFKRFPKKKKKKQRKTLISTQIFWVYFGT